MIRRKREARGIKSKLTWRGALTWPSFSTRRLICLLRCDVAPVENLRVGLLELMMAAIAAIGGVLVVKAG